VKTSVIPEASKAMPDPSDQSAPEAGDQNEPAALYRLYNTDGTLLYIGITDNPDRRFKQHRDTKPWWPQVTQKSVEWRPNRLRALADEAAAIEAETPIYNIEHNPAAQRGPVSPHHPPAGMPTDRVDALRKAASGLPTHAGEELLRAGFEGFARAQLDERATATAPSPPTDQRTWTFTNRVTGEPVTVTCMPGCAISHEGDIETPTNPVDIFCWTAADGDVTLPIDTNGKPEDYGILTTRIEVEPFSPDIARRLPHAVVEVIDEHYIAGLDPDGLMSVIGMLARRLEAMLQTHAELVRIRAEYTERDARIEGHVDRILAALREVQPEATA
jgi:predicted GIY-YIG superfamily endonuclease